MTTGYIGAHGGNGKAINGGGGGRIAVYYSAASGFDLLNRISSKGGIGVRAPSGGAGSVYTKDNTATLGEIKIDNTGRVLDGAASDLAAVDMVQ